MAGATSVGDGAGARLVDVVIEDPDSAHWSPDVEHERRVAIADLLADNGFEPLGAGPGALRATPFRRRRGGWKCGC